MGFLCQNLLKFALTAHRLVTTCVLPELAAVSHALVGITRPFPLGQILC